MRTTLLLVLMAAGARADFAEDLAQAGWSGQATTGDVTATVRRTALFSKAMLAAVKQAPLRDVARVTFAKPGWFMNAEVAAGTYSLGIEAAGGDLQLVLFDPKGARITDEGLWVRNPHDGKSSVGVTSKNGASLVHLNVGNDRLTWRFVSREAHDKVAGRLAAVTSGQVTLHTDVASEPLKGLAREADKAIGVHAKLLGRPRPQRHFHIFVVADIKKFNAFSDLVNDGAFRDRQGFQVPITGYAYVHRGALRHGGFLTMRIRSTVLHELHHQVAAALYPHMTYRWPVWLKEGLAEFGTYKCLKAAGKEFERGILGHWAHARLIGTAPQAEDLMGDSVGDPTQPFYAAAYLLAKHELSRKPKQLHGLLALLSKRVYTPTAKAAARDELTRHWGEATALYEKILAKTRKSAEPVGIWGFVDSGKDEIRIASAPKGPAKVIFPELVAGPTLTVQSSFRWEDAGQKQADLFLAYTRGQRVSQFLKVAVGLDHIILYWSRRNQWETVGRVNYDTKLPVGKWLPLKVTYDTATRKVRVETEGGRWAAFDCPHTVPLARTRVGVGGYGSVVWWKKPTLGP